MQVLLASPRRSAHTGEWITAPHQGLLSIAAVLRAGTFFDTRNVQVEVVDDQLEFLLVPNARPGACLSGHKADVVGVQAVTSNLKNAINLLDRARTLSPGVLTVLGGFAPTQEADQLVGSGAADVVVKGEGEYTFSELIYNYGTWGRAGLGQIGGITFRQDDGSVVTNPARPLIRQLDTLPFPARDLVDIPLYRRVSRGRAGNLVVSRGCSYACAYCYSKHLWGVGQRRFGVERTVAEIRSMVEEYGIDRIRIEDDDFLEDRRWLVGFCTAMIDSGLNRRVEWEAKGRPEHMEAEILRWMRQAGCFRLMMGVETLDPVLLRRLNRGLKSVALVKQALDRLSEAGIAVQATVILGIPGETAAGMRHTLQWLDEHLTGRSLIGPCFFMPFDRVAEAIVERMDFHIKNPDPDCYTGYVPVTASPACSYEELWAIYEEIGPARQRSFRRIGRLPTLEEVRRRMVARRQAG